MNTFARTAAAFGSRVRALFTTRDILVHDARGLRRVSITGRSQALAAAAGTLMLGFSGYGAAQAAQLAAQPADARIARMEHRIDAMQARVSTIRAVAKAHAERVEQRQALIAAALTGKGDEAKLALAQLAIDP
ncbi:MAG: M23 family peptidase, partial [Sphingomonas sp.]